MTENTEIVVAAGNGAIAPLPEQAQSPEPGSPYAGAGTLVLTDKERLALTHPLAPEEIKEFPQNAGSMAGLLYVDHVAIRRRLNDAFGPGAWAMVPAAAPLREASYVAQPWRLYVRGQFAAEGWGEQEFRLGAHSLTFPTALEGAKSTALMRCAKDLGIGLELWDKTFVEKFKNARKAAGSPTAPQAIPNPVSAPVRASEGPPNEKTPVRADAPAATYMISEVRDINFTSKAGKPGTRWEIRTRDGKTFKTFDRKMADNAKAAMEMDLLCKIAHTVTQWGNDVTALIVIEEHPEAPPAPPAEVTAVADLFPDSEIAR